MPVLPFVFARSEQKFLTSGLPMLIGMAATFAGIATLAAVGGAWAVRVNQYGRLLALVLLTAFAATLLSRRLADALARPFVALGNRLIANLNIANPDVANLRVRLQRRVISSLLLGVATGLLWAPCAGPFSGWCSPAPQSPGPIHDHAAVVLLCGRRGRFLGGGHSRRRACIAALKNLSERVSGYVAGSASRCSSRSQPLR